MNIIKKLKIVIILGFITYFFCAGISADFVTAQQSSTDYLQSIGISKETIQQMSDTQIDYICKKLQSCSEVYYIGYDQYNTLDSLNEKTRIGLIDRNDISISVFVAHGSINGESRYLVFPTFV